MKRAAVVAGIGLTGLDTPRESPSPPTLLNRTMANACPIPAPDERRYDEVFFRVTDEMKRKISAVIDDTYREAVAGLHAIGSEMAPPHPDFLIALAEEHLMLKMCGATPETDEVGKPAVAQAMAQNLLNRARRWQSILDERAAEAEPAV